MSDTNGLSVSPPDGLSVDSRQYGLTVTRKSVHRPIGLSVFSPNGLSVNSTVSQIIHDMNNLCEFANESDDKN